MNRLRIIRATAVLSICLLLVVGGSSVFAQAPNLLTNPGFEDPFVEQGGEPVRQVAQGWTPWHIPAEAGAPTFQNQQPEYLPAAPDTSRIRSGNNAQFLTSFFATHTGGVYQQVSNVANGAALTFSAYAYVWSSAFDDVDSSEQDGGVVVQVGIDPTGGTDPTSSSIVWSPAAQRYDAWSLYTTSADAENSTVTVYIRSTVSAPAKNNNIYIDDASLTAGGGAPVPATATSTTVVPTTVPPTATSTTAPVTPTSTLPPTATLIPSVTPIQDGGIIQPTTEVATDAPAATVAPTNTPEPTTVPPTAVPPTDIPAATVVAPTDVPPPTVEVGRPTLDPTAWLNVITITVQEGNTIASLAQLYGSSVEAILIANKMDEEGAINPGDTIQIPVRLPPVVPQATLTLVPTNTVGPAPTTAPIQPQPTAAPATTTYTVQPNDTLSRIAQQFGVTIQAIAQANGIVNPDRILLGQVLTIPLPGSPQQPPAQPTAVPGIVPTQPPPPATYTVVPGDTLFKISLQFGINIADLIRVNGLTDPNRIFIGQVLTLPR